LVEGRTVIGGKKIVILRLVASGFVNDRDIERSVRCRLLLNVDSRIQSQESAEGICGRLTAPHIVTGISVFFVSHCFISYHHPHPNSRCAKIPGASHPVD
jgi:hypothetical protein